MSDEARTPETRASVVGGCLVVLVRPRLGPVVPAEVVPFVRAAHSLYATAGLDATFGALLHARPAPTPKALLAEAGAHPVVVFTAELAEPAARALRTGGAAVSAPAPPGGSELLDAVDVMDLLRRPGGCPWDAVQTHESLRQYLVEETYELLESIELDDRAGMREELGDVLLQVLFHARVAAEHADAAFDIDSVAAGLVDKLVARHPHVFAEGEPVHTAEHQEAKWEALKQTEKRRESVVDGVASGQPALAFAGKLGQRTGRAGVPFDLLPEGTDEGSKLLRLAAAARRAGTDPEGELRAAAKRFAAQVREAERAARAAGTEPATLDADGWRRFWPRGESPA